MVQRCRPRAGTRGSCGRSSPRRSCRARRVRQPRPGGDRPALRVGAHLRRRRVLRCLGRARGRSPTWRSATASFLPRPAARRRSLCSTSRCSGSGSDPTRASSSTRQGLRRSSPTSTTIARTYFGDPGYYRIDGRPVVVLYASGSSVGPVAEAIHAIRQQSRRRLRRRPVPDRRRGRLGHEARPGPDPALRRDHRLHALLADAARRLARHDAVPPGGRRAVREYRSAAAAAASRSCPTRSPASTIVASGSVWTTTCFRAGSARRRRTDSLLHGVARRRGRARRPRTSACSPSPRGTSGRRTPRSSRPRRRAPSGGPFGLTQGSPVTSSYGTTLLEQTRRVPAAVGAAAAASARPRRGRVRLTAARSGLPFAVQAG